MLHFTTMDHPYIFRQSSFIHTKINKPVSMGTIGAISENKGFERLVQFALLCKESNVDVLISHTGVVNSKNKLNVGGLIDIPTLNRELPRSEYDNRLLKLDYILFFYDINSYRVTASGAIMDALAMKKPIIALKNDYFEYLFDKFGPIGFLVDDISQMVELTNKISLGLINDKFDFEGIRSRFAPDSIKHQFDDILSYIS